MEKNYDEQLESDENQLMVLRKELSSNLMEQLRSLTATNATWDILIGLSVIARERAIATPRSNKDTIPIQLECAEELEEAALEIFDLCDGQ
jgi:hypothetical protein